MIWKHLIQVYSGTLLQDKPRVKTVTMMKDIESMQDEALPSKINELKDHEKTSQSESKLHRCSITRQNAMNEIFDEAFLDSTMDTAIALSVINDPLHNLIRCNNEIKNLKNEWMEIKEMMQINQRKEIASLKPIQQDHIKDLKSELAATVREQTEGN